MKTIIALLLTLGACHAGHDDTRPSRSAAARQLVQIVPVAHDGDPAPAAPPALAYILPAEESGSDSGSEEALEERGGEQDDLQESAEADSEDTDDAIQAEAVDPQDIPADDDVTAPTPIELKWGARLRPAYHLSFVFGR